MGKRGFAYGALALLLAFVLAGCGNEDCPGGGFCRVVFDGVFEGGNDGELDVSGQSCGAFFCATHNPQGIGTGYGEIIACDCGWRDLTRGVSGKPQRGCCWL